jgi:hypothetical protein
MAGHSRSKNGFARLCPANHVSSCAETKTWMPGILLEDVLRRIGPGMANSGCGRLDSIEPDSAVRPAHALITPLE